MKEKKLEPASAMYESLSQNKKQNGDVAQCEEPALSPQNNKPKKSLLMSSPLGIRLRFTGANCRWAEDAVQGQSASLACTVRSQHGDDQRRTPHGKGVVRV